MPTAELLVKVEREDGSPVESLTVFLSRFRGDREQRTNEALTSVGITHDEYATYKGDIDRSDGGGAVQKFALEPAYRPGPVEGRRWARRGRVRGSELEGPSEAKGHSSLTAERNCA